MCLTELQDTLLHIKKEDVTSVPHCEHFISEANVLLQEPTAAVSEVTAGSAAKREESLCLSS